MTVYQATRAIHVNATDYALGATVPTVTVDLYRLDELGVVQEVPPSVLVPLVGVSAASTADVATATAVEVAARNAAIAAQHTVDNSTYVSLAPAPLGGGLDDLAALTAALPTRGILKLRDNAVYRLSGMLTVGNGQDIQGGGGSMTAPATTLLCTAAGAGVTVTGTGGLSGNLTIDGNSVATSPFTRSTGAQRTFVNLSAVSGVQDNWTILASQNDLYLGCNSQFAGRDNLVIDKGAGGLLFSRFEANAPTRYGVRIDNAVAGGPYVAPTHIAFDHAIFERGGSSATVVSQVLVTAGDLIRFDNCVITSLGAVAISGPCVDIATTGQVIFDGGFLIGNTATDTGMGTAAGNNITITGRYRLQNLLNGISIGTGNPQIQVIGDIYFNTVTNRYVGSGAQNTSVRFRTVNPVEIVRETTADSGWTVSAKGEAGQRIWANADGSLNFGDGTGFSQKASLFTGGTGILAMPVGQVLRTGHAVTGSRPAAATAGAGGVYYDDTLGKPIFSDGTIWRNADGRPAAVTPLIGALRSGFYYGTPAASVSSAAMTQSTLYVTPLVIPVTTTVVSIACDCTVVAASSVVRLGIYADDGAGAPGALVLDAGTVDTSAGVAVKEIVISQVLTPGVYWLGGVAQGGAPTMRNVASAATVGRDNNVMSVLFGCYTVAAVTGALPTPFGTPLGASSGMRVTVKAA